MAYHSKFGLVDLYDGREDLKNGLIRAVGEPEERFSEDALRILRALRFAGRFDFQIESATAEAIHRCRMCIRDRYAVRERKSILKALTNLFRAFAVVSRKNAMLRKRKRDALSFSRPQSVGRFI